jgi:ABC-type Zn uptake system ZnuABC Zn-binding protein ZnuA
LGQSIERILGDEHDVVLLTSPRAALDEFHAKPFDIERLREMIRE